MTIPPEYAGMSQRPWAPHVNPQGWAATKSGLIIPHRDRKARYGKWPIALDLFAGCGGFSLGFIQAGWRVVGAVEWDDMAAITYMRNLGTYPIEIHYSSPDDKKRLDKALNREIKRETKNGVAHMPPMSGSGWIKNNGDVAGVPHFWFGDIRQITGVQILDALQLEAGDLDAIMGGPPCQGFSVAGKQDIMDPRNSLVFEFCRLVCELQPATMCMENVPAMAKMTTPEGINVIDAIAHYLEDGGYGRTEATRKALMQTAGMGAAWKKGETKAQTDRAERRREERAAKKSKAPATRQMGFDLEAVS